VDKDLLSHPCDAEKLPGVAMSEPRPWHRLFGLSLVDFFRGLPVQVELEKVLSLKQQLLDVVIIHKQAESLPCKLPDGFEEMAAHNLITFKSYQEALDGWSLNELVGHYVNYRKQASPSMQELLPETDFRLFALTVRFPNSLARQTAMALVRPGVYDVCHFTGMVRVVVVHELPKVEHNALLHLFSAQAELLEYGATHYRLRSTETSTILLQLFERYQLEATLMPDELEELTRETVERILRNTPAKELAKRLSPDEYLATLSPETRLKGLSPDELLAAVSPETRAILAQRLKDDTVPPKPDSN
jgi:hypothetical protein